MCGDAIGFMRDNNGSCVCKTGFASSGSECICDAGKVIIGGSGSDERCVSIDSTTCAAVTRLNGAVCSVFSDCISTGNPDG